jgi:hypothetical protein
MNRPVSLALLMLAACSSKNAVPPKPSPLVGTWKPWLSPVAEGHVYDVFDDASGIWRCTEATCVHFGPGGGETARFELPCDTASRAVSPSATLYAASCPRSNTEHALGRDGRVLVEQVVEDVQARVRHPDLVQVGVGQRDRRRHRGQVLLDRVDLVAEVAARALDALKQVVQGRPPEKGAL